MSDLNGPQRAAMRYIDGPLLVLAGAGSGKTRVVVHKIAYLIRDCGIGARNIAAVTFTNKAAREMKVRAAGLLAGRDGRGLTVCTFHTLGLTMVKRDPARLGYKPGFSIFDAADAAGVVRELLRREHGGDGAQEQALLARISHWKSALISPAAALAQAADELEAAAARLYGAYERQLAAYNAVDFDDLIARPVQLLQAHADAREHWQNRIRYLLVDEYQDTNAAQYELVKLLSGARAALTVVGDDDQSVYAWRGARPENLRRLRDDFPRLRVIKLEQNYRSTGCILKAANQLIANNPHVFEKRLWSELGSGDPLRVLHCRDAEHEAERVVSALLHQRFKHRTEYRDHAILYRGNHQSRPFERVLREHDIPYHLSGGTSFFEYGEIKDLMAYLRLLVNPDNDAAFLRIVNTPRREIGAATLEKLAHYASERAISLLAASFELGLETRLGTRALERLRAFAGQIVDLADRAARGDPLAAVRTLLHQIDYAGWLRDTCEEAAAERRMDNVQELLGWMQRLTEREQTGGSLSDLVAHMSLMDILNRDDEAGGNAVHLMTLHAAKGLEFDHVFIVGMEEELLPHRSSMEQNSLEEERRLAYVGITRARRTLTFTLTTHRKRYGERVACEPSRFLAELPADDLVWEGAETAADPQQRMERGQAHLANLRGLLGKG